MEAPNVILLGDADSGKDIVLRTLTAGTASSAAAADSGSHHSWQNTHCSPDYSLFVSAVSDADVQKQRKLVEDEQLVKHIDRYYTLQDLKRDISIT